MSYTRRSRINKLVLVGLLALTILLASSLAFATESDTISKTIRYVAGDPIPEIPKELTKNGVKYQLKDNVGAPRIVSVFTTGREYHTASRIDHISIKSVQNEQYKDDFAALIPINQDGYIGVLARQAYEVIPYYMPRTRKVERQITLRRSSEFWGQQSSSVYLSHLVLDSA